MVSPEFPGGTVAELCAEPVAIQLHGRCTTGLPQSHSRRQPLSLLTVLGTAVQTLNESTCSLFCIPDWHTSLRPQAPSGHLGVMASAVICMLQC